MAEEVEFAITFDRSAPGAFSAKLVQGIRQAIDDGILRPNDQLPSTRALAHRLGLSRGTVVVAYEQLVAEGYFTTGQGRGTRVNPGLAGLHGVTQRRRRADGQKMVPATLETPNSKTATQQIADHRDTLSDLTARPAWRAAWRKAAASPRLGQAFPVEGDPELLTEIVEHLRTMRGTVREPRDLLVTAGAREGLSLILTALGTTRGRQLTVAVEESGPTSLHEVAARHGVQIVALPVDAEGLVTSQLPSGVIDAVIVAPSHQYPRGAALSLARRHELLEWAKHAGAVVIEDDFDTELRFLSAPLPTLAALDDPDWGVVATLGSYSATLSPGLAAGFLVLPINLLRLVYPVRADLGCPVSPILQLALAELLSSGELRRHIARVRRARQRDSIARVRGDA